MGKRDDVSPSNTLLPAIFARELKHSQSEITPVVCGTLGSLSYNLEFNGLVNRDVNENGDHSFTNNHGTLEAVAIYEKKGVQQPPRHAKGL